MIIDPQKIKILPEFVNVPIEDIKLKLMALEKSIREHTNNNFQNRNVRFISSIANKTITVVNQYLKVGDSVQISQSNVNDGTYSIKEINENGMLLDGEVYDINYNLITKVVYSEDIQKGVIDIMLWEVENRKKVGIKSETISRHTVTYFDMDANNLLGYPTSLLGFLTPYIKARF